MRQNGGSHTDGGLVQRFLTLASTVRIRETLTGIVSIINNLIMIIKHGHYFSVMINKSTGKPLAKMKQKVGI